MAEAHDLVGAHRRAPRTCEAVASASAVACSGAPVWDVVTTSTSGRELLRHPACEAHGRAEVRRAAASGQIATTDLRGPFVIVPPSRPEQSEQSEAGRLAAIPLEPQRLAVLYAWVATDGPDGAQEGILTAELSGTPMPLVASRRATLEGLDDFVRRALAGTGRGARLVAFTRTDVLAEVEPL